MSNVKRNGKRQPREKHSIKRKPKLGYYYIITDGEKTEPYYFKGLKKNLSKDDQEQIVLKTISTKTEKLIHEALEQARQSPQYAEIWIVFDRDKVQNFDKIIEKAETKDINVGWSNPCIEIWFHAYFLKMPIPKDSIQCIANFKREFESKTGKDYGKSDAETYTLLTQHGNEAEAIKLMERRYLENKELYEEVPSLHCPGTTVHRLIKALKEKT